MDGWIKLYRKLLDDVVWQTSTSEQKVILITLLLLASHKENEWYWQGKKFKVGAGQLVSSLSNIASMCGNGISLQNVRSAIEKFRKMNFLTNQSTKTGRLITIVNWDKYQTIDDEDNKESNKEVTKSQQRGNKELTSIKNVKNDKNVKNNTYIVEILDHMNKKLNTNYKATTKKTSDLINTRLKEGYSVNDFIKVINKKCSEWLNSDMAKYLRPETLFGNKFESYLNQKEGEKVGGNERIKFELPRESSSNRTAEEIERDIRELGLI